MRLTLTRRNWRGFTIVEVLVVLAIIAMLAGVVGPKIMKFLGGSKTRTAKLQIEDFSTTLDLYQLDIGRYPTTSEGLAALIIKPADANNWNGPYLKKQQVPKDPWGQDYHYQQPGEGGRPFDIYSLGSDNKEGGDGDAQDIHSWD